MHDNLHSVNSAAGNDCWSIPSLCMLLHEHWQGHQHDYGSSMHSGLYSMHSDAKQLTTGWRNKTQSYDSHLQDASVGAREAGGQSVVDVGKLGIAGVGASPAARQDVPVRPVVVGPVHGSRMQVAGQQ